METNVLSTLEISSTEEEKLHNAKVIAKRRRSSAARLSVSSGSGKRKGRKIRGLKHPALELVPLTKPAKFKELRDLSLFALGASNESPSFVDLKDRTNINTTVVVLIPGIDATEFIGADVQDSPVAIDTLPKEFSFLKANFTHLVPMSAPGDKESVYPLMKVYTKRPYTKQQKNKILKELTDKKLVLPDLAMTKEELLMNKYPVDTKDQEGWVDTFGFEHEGSHTFAMDCEMVNSASGKVLARVSVVDFNENVLLDEYVKPEEEIIDYLTQYSGITEELLRDVTTTLSDIQKRILDIVSADDYLVGHSLENDLQVLKLRHEKIVDTAIVFKHPRGPPFKSSLKYLTKQYLDRTIQEGEHDSVEDSKACLDLVKLKLVEGPLLGCVIDGELIFDDLSKVHKRALIIDFQRVQKDQDRYLDCFNDDDVVEKVLSNVSDYDLVVAHLKEIESAQDISNYDSNKSRLFSDLNKRMEKIYANTPANSVVVFSMCNGDQTRLKEMRAKKSKSRHEMNQTGCNTEYLWTYDDEQQLRECATYTRRGVVFVKMKDPETTSALE